MAMRFIDSYLIALAVNGSQSIAKKAWRPSFFYNYELTPYVYKTRAFLIPIRLANQIPFLVGLDSRRLIVSKPSMILPKHGSPAWISELSSVFMKKLGLPSAANPMVFFV